MKIKRETRIHFVGVGGIGLSALARYFKAQGYFISGSDASTSVIVHSLRSEGITVSTGNTVSPRLKEASLVVYSRAIPADNAELVVAKKLGIPIVPYAKILGELTEEYTTIAITGSHGKSTTTALAALALIKGGLDPTVLVGTNLKEFNGKNIRIGQSSYLVLEADDFQAAFLEYSPVVTIITNIDREHMDFYKTLGGVKKAFVKFIARTQENGVLILNRDDKNLFSLKKQIDLIAKKKKLRVVWYSIGNLVSAKSSAGKSKDINSKLTALKKAIKIPGLHNLSNAMAIVELGKLLKLNEKKTLAAIGSYQGAWRRMEFRGEFSMNRSSKAKVFDDYAHHPTEIKATLQAFREKFSRLPLMCVFQPHQTKRLQLLFKEFVSAFGDADVLILIPSYKVAGRDDANPKFTAKYLASAIAKKYPTKTVYYFENPAKIKTVTQQIIMSLPSSSSSTNPVIIMMGAGDIVKYTDKLIH